MVRVVVAMLEPHCFNPPGIGGWAMIRMRRRLLLAMVAVGAMAGAAGASENSTYTYDALGRLVATSHSGGPRSGTTVASSYDEAGNRKAMAVNQALPTQNTAASFSIAGPGTVAKGALASFVISKTGPASAAVTLNFATADGTAISPGHYGAVSGTLSFAAWETQKTVQVQTINDNSGSPARQFTMTISSPSAGGTIATATAPATIAGTNPPPVAVADNATVGTCSTKFINVVANDTDPSGSYPLTLVSISGGSAGTATLYSSTTISYNAFGVPANDTIIYTVRNAAGATATGTLDIAIVDKGGCN